MFILENLELGSLKIKTEHHIDKRGKNTIQGKHTKKGQSGDKLGGFESIVFMNKKKLQFFLISKFYIRKTFWRFS